MQISEIHKNIDPIETPKSEMVDNDLDDFLLGQQSNKTSHEKTCEKDVEYLTSDNIDMPNIEIIDVEESNFSKNPFSIASPNYVEHESIG